ncbi:MAG: T9SS type A sorting domain-containing protein [candidate division KSB1 bacterium]|nr:T9SS type A sorting domain-containing protein [candidate division KSB1 bacterium]
MKKLFYGSLSILLLITGVLAVDYDQTEDFENKQGLRKRSGHQSIGIILDRISLLSERTSLGVTVVDNQYIVSSTNNAGDNYFDIYSFDGSYVESVSQNTEYSGYQDLAFDGTYILASKNQYIRKIDPSDFTEAEKIYNDTYARHRGLAYDPNKDVIYSSNSNNGPIIKIDPETGKTIKTFEKPDDYHHFGIAFDSYSQEGFSSLWLNAPYRSWEPGFFRLNRVDTARGRVNFMYEMSEEMADSALSGGLEIINNHPDYPERTVAVAIDQKNHEMVLVDITDAPNILPIKIEKVNEFGGWEDGEMIISGEVIVGNYLYVVDNYNNELVIYDIGTDPVNPIRETSVELLNGNKIYQSNNYLYVTHGLPASSFSIYDLEDPLNPQEKSSYDVGETILDIVFGGDYAYVLPKGSDQVTVFDVVGNVKEPRQVSTYQLNGPGTNLEINYNSHLLFAGYYGGEYNAGYEMIELSDPAELACIDRMPSNGKRPQRLKLIDNQYIAFLDNDMYFNETWMSIYQYSSGNELRRMESGIVSWDTTSQDMNMLGETICVSVPGEGIKTYAWDPDIYDPQEYEPDSGLVIKGPQYELSESLDFVSYHVYDNPGQSRMDISADNDQLSKAAFGWNVGYFIYILRGIVIDDELNASDQIFALLMSGFFSSGDDVRVQSTHEKPDHFMLYPNYPNPFNPTTTIVYDLSQASHTEMTVYDLTGRIVEQLVSTYQNAGQYSVIWNAKQCPSGVYFIRLSSGSHTSVRKVMLLK